jgi:hypothetical protein
MIEKLNYTIQDHERQLMAALEELNNENLTVCESRTLHVEISKLTFSLRTLKFIKND